MKSNDPKPPIIYQYLDPENTLNQKFAYGEVRSPKLVNRDVQMRFYQDNELPVSIRIPLADIKSFAQQQHTLLIAETDEESLGSASTLRHT